MKLKFLITASFFSVVISAQEVQTISLKDAIEYALQNKADAKKAALQIENSEYLIQEARAGALPKINAHGGLTYNPILQETAIPTSSFPGFEDYPEPFLIMAMGQKWNSVAGITLSQNLFDQTVFTGLKAAKTTREFYRINAELTEQQIIERVSTAYYNVYIQQEQLKTIDESYDNMERVSKVIQSLYENGLAREIDLDRVNVQLTNLKSARQQLINAVALTENALKFYIGMPIEQPIALEEGDFEVTQILLEDTIETENRTEYQILKKQDELLKLQKQAFKAAYYPKLSLMASYNYLGQGDRMPIGAGLSKGVYWSDYSSIGLNLSIPIFNGNEIKAKVSQADIQIRELEQQLADTKLGLNLEYQNAKAQIENNYIAIENQQENVNLAQKVVNNTQNNYSLGLATLTDLLESENALINAKNNYSNAVLQLKLAQIQLLKSKGELNTLKEGKL
ncbi:MAG: TolC family protein [Weeksellaceae bacterium]